MSSFWRPQEAQHFVQTNCRSYFPRARARCDRNSLAIFCWRLAAISALLLVPPGGGDFYSVLPARSRLCVKLNDQFIEKKCPQAKEHVWNKVTKTPQYHDRSLTRCSRTLERTQELKRGKPTRSARSPSWSRLQKQTWIKTNGLLPGSKATVTQYDKGIQTIQRAC